MEKRKSQEKEEVTEVWENKEEGKCKIEIVRIEPGTQKK